MKGKTSRLLLFALCLLIALCTTGYPGVPSTPSSEFGIFSAAFNGSNALNVAVVAPGAPLNPQSTYGILAASFNGSNALNVICLSGCAPTAASISANATLAADLTFATGGVGGITATLPAASSVAAGRAFEIKKVDAAAGAVTVAAAGADTIDGQTSYVLANQWAFVKVASDGVSAWNVQAFGF